MNNSYKNNNNPHSNKTIKIVSTNNYISPNMNLINSNKIIVLLRIRPSNERETNHSNINIIEIENRTSIKVLSPLEYNFFIDGTKYLKNEKGLEITKVKEYEYKFDRVFSENSNQKEIYDSSSFLVKNIFDGYNSTILTYGSVGTGKSYTMIGTKEQPGILYRVISDILIAMNTKYQLQISCFEIHNEKIYDLLSIEKKIINFLEEEKNDEDFFKNNNTNNKFFLLGLTKKIIDKQENIWNIINKTNKNRNVGKKNNNIFVSLKSHIIFQLEIISKKNNINEIANNTEYLNYGKFILVDMAGSERAIHIKPNSENYFVNKSLFNFANCVNDLLNNKSHNFIPWRDSKLTRVLKDSLLGNSKIVLIANISPSYMSIDNTLDTLNFTKKIKLIKIKAQRNILSGIPHINKYDSAIKDLQKQIKNIDLEIERNENLENENYDIDISKYINDIKVHFNKEIDLNKKIIEMEQKISNTNYDIYIFKEKNILNSENKTAKLNEYIKILNKYQKIILDLYNERHKIIQQRKNIQCLINKETKNNISNKNIGKYLMYVYKYYINVIKQLQCDNRSNKNDLELKKKNNQIKILSNQIVLRDKEINELNEKNKTGNNMNFNIISLKEINLDPCQDFTLNFNDNDNNNIANIKQIQKNFSMPYLNSGSNIKVNITQNVKKDNLNILPQINTINNSRIIESNASSSKKINLRNVSINNSNSVANIQKFGDLDSLRLNIVDQYENYNNPLLYKVSNNNYYLNNVKSNMKNKNLSLSNKNLVISKSNNNSSVFSPKFESYYANKVKTILQKNIISRYKHSPYNFNSL